MSDRKRIKLTHGSARVDENCSRATIKALDKLSILAYEMENEPLNIDSVSKSVTCENYNNGFYDDYGTDLCENCGERKGKHN